MKTEELREEMLKKKDVLEKLIELWKSNASDDDTLKVIKDAGIDATYDDVEKLLALVQKKQAEGISFEKIDVNEIVSVSGGKYGGMKCSNIDDCDDKFLDGTDLVSLDERCYAHLVCDEFMNL